MKTILIATDFSDVSRNAMLYGFEFAKAVGAKVILFHAYKEPLLARDSLIESLNRMHEIVETQMANEKTFIDVAGSYDFETACKKGDAADTILKNAEALNVSIIIAGITGRDKTMRKIFGSTATALVKHSRIPLLIIPEGVKYTAPGSVVFANDVTSDTDMHTLDNLKEIIEKFKARLFVVKVVKNKTEEWSEMLNAPETLKMAVRRLDSQFDYPVDKDVVQALNDFTEQHHAQMIAMMPHKHSWTQMLFEKSNTKGMILHTKVPLLILPEKDYEGLLQDPRKYSEISKGLVL